MRIVDKERARVSGKCVDSKIGSLNFDIERWVYKLLIKEKRKKKLPTMSPHGNVREFEG